jgi:acyl carrier protein
MTAGHSIPSAAPSPALVREVCRFLADELERDASGIDEETRLVDDLEADSITMLALFEHIQLHYAVGIDLKTMAAEARSRNIGTVGELCQAIADFLASGVPLRVEA